ncbi:hypothetical protein HYY75_07785 [bacterium]|nr:hypothetical protein [bacterium]
MAVQGANDSLSQIDRDAIAQEIDQLLQYMVEVGNTDVGGEFIFGGNDVTSKPFETIDGQNPNMMKDVVTFGLGEDRKNINASKILDVRYKGDEKKIQTEIEKGITLSKNVSGSELFFRQTPISNQPTFGDRLTPLTKMLPLDVLNNGSGVQKGSVVLTDENGVDTWVDLSRALRLDDVIYAINSTRGFEAGIEEVPSDTAQALGLLKNAGPTNTLIGQSDAAMLSTGTTLASLNNGSGVPPGFLNINTRDGKNHRVDISLAVTVNDVVNLINAADGGTSIRAQFDMVHNRFEITDITGGTGDFSIDSKKNQLYLKDLPARVATDLGILKNSGANNQIFSTFDPALQSETTPISFLNGGKGIEKGYIRIVGRNGVSTNIDLRAALTFQDVINSINLQAGGLQTASFDAVGKRLLITDNTAGASNFRVEEVDGLGNPPAPLPVRVRDATTIARRLGLLKSSQGTAIAGDSIGIGLTAASQLSTIVPPPDVGFIVIRDANGNPTEVNLSQASTIQDVLDRINQTNRFQAIWDGPGQRFIVNAVSSAPGGKGLQIEEKTNTARDLGWVLGTANYSRDKLTGAPVSVKQLPTLIGSIDLDPAVVGDTELSSLNSNRTFNKGVSLGRIRITDKAGNFKTIDLRGLKTVQEVLNKINDPTNGIYIEGKINSNKNGIEIIDKNRGANGFLEVIDVDSTTAYDLGISGRTPDTKLTGSDLDPAVTESTIVSALRVNQGGVPLSKVYVQSGDFSGEIDLTGAKTVGDLLNKFSSTDTRFNLSAWIDSDGNRINLTNSKGQPFIKVRDLGKPEEASASGLGLGGTKGIFETLQDLRDNLLRSDVKGISERSIKSITEDLERTLQLHAETGARTNRVQGSKEKQENVSFNIKKLLDVVENIDMPEAITRMTQLETAFQAALQTGAKILQTTLLEFLR